MKNLWLHGIYLSIIGALCFQLWSKTTEMPYTFGQVDQVLKSDNEVLRKVSDDMLYTIERNYLRNPKKYETVYNNAKKIRTASQLSSNFIDINLTNTKLNVSLNLNDFKNSLNNFSQKSTFVDDKVDSITLLKHCILNKTIENQTFWKGFMSYPSTNFLLLKNQNLLDEIVYLNYFMDRVSGKIEIDDAPFIVFIDPKKAVLIEGEKFEADIFLGKYSSNPGMGLSFTANNQDLTIKDGVAKYSKTESSIGLKTIKVIASIRNPATGETTQRIGEFEYHVLPKCSQNCQ